MILKIVFFFFFCKIFHRIQNTFYFKQPKFDVFTFLIGSHTDSPPNSHSFVGAPNQPHPTNGNLLIQALLKKYCFFLFSRCNVHRYTKRMMIYIRIAHQYSSGTLFSRAVFDTRRRFGRLRIELTSARRSKGFRGGGDTGRCASVMSQRCRPLLHYTHCREETLWE